MLNLVQRICKSKNSQEKDLSAERKQQHERRRRATPMELSKTVGLFRVCKGHLDSDDEILMSLSCTTEEDGQSAEPSTPRNPSRFRNQRCHISSTSELLLRNTQNNTSNTYIWLKEDSLTVSRRPTSFCYDDLRHPHTILPGN